MDEACTATMQTLAGQALADVRTPLLRSAKLFTTAGRMIVTVLELLPDLAVATTQAPPPAGSIAVLARSGVRIAATVAWADGRRFGLRFDDPIDGNALDRFAGNVRDTAVRLPALVPGQDDRARA